MGHVGPGAGEKLNFVKSLFTKTGVNAGPRTYRNNLVFLLAEGTRVQGLKDAVKSLIAWERVQKDVELEQSNLAQAGGAQLRGNEAEGPRRRLRRAGGFMALDDDLRRVREQLGPQELNVRTRLLEAYRVLAFPRGGDADRANSSPGTPWARCSNASASTSARRRRKAAPAVDRAANRRRGPPAPVPAAEQQACPGGHTRSAARAWLPN